MKALIVLALLSATCLPNRLCADDSQVLSELKQIRRQIDNLISQLEKNAETLRAAGDANLRKSQRIALRTRDGFYLRAKLGGSDDVVADVKTPKTSVIFTLEWVTLESVRLRTREGFYVGARRGGGANVDATVKEPKTSEVFTVKWQDDQHTKIRLRTREGFYIHPVRGGGGDVNARIRNPKASEVFTLVLDP